MLPLAAVSAKVYVAPLVFGYISIEDDSLICLHSQHSFHAILTSTSPHDDPHQRIPGCSLASAPIQHPQFSLMVQLPSYRFHPHPSAIRADHAATRLPCQLIPIRGHCITVTDPAPDSFRSAIVSPASHPFSLWYRPSTDLLAAAPCSPRPPLAPRLPPTARSGHHSSARRRFIQGVRCFSGFWLRVDRG
jgi:hypothetical protein